MTIVANGYAPVILEQCSMVRTSSEAKCFFIIKIRLICNYTTIGELFITGRIKELIIVRGRNLYPHDVEDSVGLFLVCYVLNFCSNFDFLRFDIVIR